MVKKVQAKELQLTDKIIFPEYGTRAWPIKSLSRVSGPLSVEVVTQGKGTWHFKPSDMITIQES